MVGGTVEEEVVGREVVEVEVAVETAEGLTLVGGGSVQLRACKESRKDTEVAIMDCRQH